ncbi:leucine Rich Repeat [Seminavis robusta]|uniref:Leucine Rich Repeat n=1 Tax=Seminavis robusta TaxID=568900 RepID=A0A9N8F4N2_9STRA|nr:leucine Rich Repeat [Seminavis robusta]|eukprot:Sro3025_g342280.1 leucine Rich Repeat (716) ;mRNA; r:345-3448
MKTTKEQGDADDSPNKLLNGKPSEESGLTRFAEERAAKEAARASRDSATAAVLPGAVLQRSQDRRATQKAAKNDNVTNSAAVAGSVTTTSTSTDNDAVIQRGLRRSAEEKAVKEAARLATKHGEAVGATTDATSTDPIQRGLRRSAEEKAVKEAARMATKQGEAVGTSTDATGTDPIQRGLRRSAEEKAVKEAARMATKHGEAVGASNDTNDAAVASGEAVKVLPGNNTGNGEMQPGAHRVSAVDNSGVNNNHRGSTATKKGLGRNSIAAVQRRNDEREAPQMPLDGDSPNALDDKNAADDAESLREKIAVASSERSTNTLTHPREKSTKALVESPKEEANNIAVSARSFDVESQRRGDEPEIVVDNVDGLAVATAVMDESSKRHYQEAQQVDDFKLQEQAAEQAEKEMKETQCRRSGLAIVLCSLLIIGLSLGPYENIDDDEYNHKIQEIPCDSLGRLISLRLDSLELSGHTPYVPQEITMLRSLTLLQLSFSGIDTPITSLLPSGLFNMGALTHLDLADNSFTGLIPSKLQEFSGLRYLTLDGNEFTGPIPLELLRLPDLTTLFLDDNQLSGQIPSELGLLTRVTDLALNRNKLTGQLPSEIAQLKSLDYLWLQKNQLSGEIPSFLGDMIRLEELRISENELTGEFPKELGSLKFLTSLFLFKNQLTGTLPKELGFLMDLMDLRLYDNLFTGTFCQSWDSWLPWLHCGFKGMS